MNGSNVETTEISSSVRDNIEYLCRIGASEPRFLLAIALARKSEMDLRGTVRVLRAALLPPSPFQWSKLGNPNQRELLKIAGALDELGRAILPGSERESDDFALSEPTAEVLKTWPDIPSLVLFGERVPCRLSDAVCLIGAEEATRRLLAFALVLRDQALVS